MADGFEPRLQSYALSEYLEWWAGRLSASREGGPSLVDALLDASKHIEALERRVAYLEAHVASEEAP